MPIARADPHELVVYRGYTNAVREEKKADEGVTGTKVDVPGVPEEPAAPTIVVE